MQSNKQVILVLGKRLVNQQLTDEGKLRITGLADYLQSNSLSFDTHFNHVLIIFCGGITQGQQVSEAQAMYDYWQQNFPMLASQFTSILENKSTNTVENFKFSADQLIDKVLNHQAWIDEHSLITVTLLSHEYHLKRLFAIECFMQTQGLMHQFQYRFKQQCVAQNIQIEIKSALDEHIAIEYTDNSMQGEAFILIDALTLFRVFLEVQCRSEQYQFDQTMVADIFKNTYVALTQLKQLPLTNDIQQQVTQLLVAVQQVELNQCQQQYQHSLSIYHATLSRLNRELDPELQGA